MREFPTSGASNCILIGHELFRRKVTPLGVLACFCLMMALAACSSANADRSGEVDSDIKTAKSLAAETLLFLDQFAQDRTTEQFGIAYVGYLQEQAGDLAKSLTRVASSGPSSEKLEECETQTHVLRSALALLQLNLRDRRALSLVREQIKVIDTRLSAISPPL
jgi:hypothetical protein